ncbi:MAG: TIGR00730 family Rossman fold protein [Bacteroidales bacterium]|nr:TIGR00730 family Rossman fold protein [Bacteroidales bacterium]
MKKKIESIALFCGSSEGKGERYVRLAEEFGKQCAQRKVLLYYGGAKLGLMNAAATAAMKAGGKVIGIVPDFFSKEAVIAEDITELVYVKSMSERKQMLEKKADAFVVFPGSFGTMDEFFELITDAQLGFHNKPIVIFNPYGYYDSLLKQLVLFKEEGFLRPFHFQLIVCATTVEDVFHQIESYEYSNDAQWVQEHTVHER